MDNYVIHFHQASIHVTDASQPVKEQLARLVDSAALTEDDESWTPAVNLLVAALQPACIYKIEHWVSSENGKQRYLNFIVLLHNYRTKSVSEYDAILQLVHQQGEQLQCFIHHVHTVIEWMDRGHPFYCRYMVRQNLIYSDGSVEIAAAGASAVRQMKQQIRQQFAVSFHKALDFYECAQYLRQRQGEQPILIVFMLNQAVDLGYRSVLENLNGYCKKTHDIRQHMKLAPRCAPALLHIFPDDTKEEKRLLDVLEAAYSGARYDNSYDLPVSTVNTLFERVESFLKIAEEAFWSEIGITDRTDPAEE